MATSQNGYFVFMDNRTTGALPRLRLWQIPGTGRHAYLRDGSVGFLLTYMAVEWDRNVETIDQGIWDEWGWAVRPIRGQTSGYSNHASGTALDINATLHPRGVSTRSTMSAAKVGKVHTLLDQFGGCIRWGGDYTGVPDAMHVEINKGMADVERKARELWSTAIGQEIHTANPGASDVIWDGKVPSLKKPTKKPAKKPTPKTPSDSERLAIDYSYARPDPKAVKAAGYRGVMRYLSPNPAKNISRAEAKALHDAGLWIGLVWERSANRASAGHAAGVEDARAANQQADGLGVPDSVTIIYAVDYDANPADVKAYFDGAKAASKRPVGIYGGYRVIEAITADAYWQTVAWSGGKVSKKANWFQRTTHSHSIKGSKASDWDENLLIGGAVPVWKAVKAEPTPAPKPVVVTEFVSGTFNSQQTDTAAQQVADLGNLTKRASLWGLQEITTDAQRSTIEAMKGWGAFPDLTTGTSPCAIPILWDTSVWGFVNGYSIKVHGGQVAVTPTRWINVAHLIHLASGKPVTRINTHVVHHIEAGGLPRKYVGVVEKAKYALQLGRAEKHFALLADTIKTEAALGAPVIIGGDFNVNLFAEQHLPVDQRYPGFPLTVLSLVAKVVTPSEPTNGTRAIDQTWYVNATDGLCVVQPLGNSDHRAVTTRFAI